MTYDGVPELMAGFPPAPESQVTLANWQDPPFNRWAFQHMRELIPSHPIPAGQPAPLRPPACPWATRRWCGSTAARRRVEDVLAGTYTDAFLVLHDGQVVAERYDAGMTAGTRHLLMSVSKSILGCAAGVLADRGLLDLQAPVTTYVPEVSGSGYAGATIRDLLDMRTGVAFRETYTALDAEVRVMERSMGWRPAQPGDPAGAYPYLATLGSAGPHGGEFSYRSADSRHARLGVRAGQRRPGRRPHLRPHLAADRGGAGRRDHLRSARLGHTRRRDLGHGP